MKMKKNIKTTILLILGAVTLMASVFIFILEVVFNNLPFSSKYGLVEISVNGKPLYFKREARGLNYDSVILSADGNYCAEYNPELDYRFTSLDDTIYYKIDSGVLYLLTGNPVLSGYNYQSEQYIVQPKKFPVKVVIIEPDKLIIYEKRKELYKDKGLQLLEIQLVDDLKCSLIGL